MSQELEGTLTNSANLVGTFGSTGSGTSNYNDLANKPSINSVELVGNKTANQLGLVSDTDLATVATTGNYNDLLHKPTIPAAQVNSDWNAISGVARILNKPTIPTKTSDLTNDSGFVESSDLATVATTGDYDDLTNKPTIPAAQVNSDWDSTSGVSEILNKPTLSTVATSGSYNDLTDTPTIPTNSDFDLSGLGDVSVSGATQGQVLTKGVSGWEASSLNIPTKTSDLNNDSNFMVTPTTVTQAITVNTGGGLSGSGSIQVWGKVVTLSALITVPNSGITQSIAWLSGQSSNSYRPSASRWLSCDAYNTSGKTAECQIDENGVIRLSTNEGGKDYKISGCWIAVGS